MPQVGVAASAPDLDPMHAMTEVIQAGNGRIAYRLEIAGPATAGVELGIGIEQWRITADAMVDARRPGIVVLAGEGALGGAEPADLELLIGQLLTPRVERFFQLVHR